MLIILRLIDLLYESARNWFVKVWMQLFLFRAYMLYQCASTNSLKFRCWIICGFQDLLFESAQIGCHSEGCLQPEESTAESLRFYWIRIMHSSWRRYRQSPPEIESSDCFGSGTSRSKLLDVRCPSNGSSCKHGFPLDRLIAHIRTPSSQRIKRVCFQSAVSPDPVALHTQFHPVTVCSGCRRIHSIRLCKII